MLWLLPAEGGWGGKKCVRTTEGLSSSPPPLALHPEHIPKMKHTKNTLKLKTEKVKYLCVHSEHTTVHRLFQQGRQSERLKNCSPKILCPPCYCRSSALTRATRIASCWCVWIYFKIEEFFHIFKGCPSRHATTYSSYAEHKHIHYNFRLKV